MPCTGGYEHYCSACWLQQWLSVFYFRDIRRLLPFLQLHECLEYLYVLHSMLVKRTILHAIGAHQDQLRMKALGNLGIRVHVTVRSITDSEPRSKSLIYSITSGIPHSYADSRYETAGGGKSLLPEELQFGTEFCITCLFLQQLCASALVQWIPWPTAKSDVRKA